MPATRIRERTDARFLKADAAPGISRSLSPEARSTLGSARPSPDFTQEIRSERPTVHAQALPEYKDRTTFIITTDHGRGSGPVLWKDHGVEQPGSDRIWYAVIGPDTPALGERAGVSGTTQAQLAATVADLLGYDFRSFKPEAALSLLPVLQQGN